MKPMVCLPPFFSASLIRSQVCYTTSTVGMSRRCLLRSFTRSGNTGGVPSIGTRVAAGGVGSGLGSSIERSTGAAFGASSTAATGVLSAKSSIFLGRKAFPV